MPISSSEEFLQRYALNVTRGGIYLHTRNLKPPGTPVVLEVLLENGTRILFANAMVVYVTGNRGDGVPGMGLKFITLDKASRTFLQSMAAMIPPARTEEPPRPRNVGPLDSSPDALSSFIHAPTSLSSSDSGLRSQGLAAVAAAAAETTSSPTPPPIQTSPSGLHASQAHATLPSEQKGRLSVQGGHEDGVQAPAFVSDPEPERTGPIIGIDLGTTNSVAAVVRDGMPILLRSRDGDTLLPSVVALTPKGQIIVGEVAKAQAQQNPKYTISGFKRLIGRSFAAPDVQDLLKRFAFEVVPTEDGECGVQLGDKLYRLEELSALLLREVKHLAAKQLGHPVNRAVITVPAWYTERQRQAVRLAGRLAGLHVERIVNEPTAAALSYGYGRQMSARVLVYDLGGGTFDASVLELNDSVYEVVSTGGDNFLGGIDFDNAIVSWLRDEFEAQHRVPLTDRVALMRLSDAAERAKILLSEKTEAKISVPFVTMLKTGKVDIDLSLSRAKLVALTRHFVDKTMDVCSEVLRAQAIRADQIDALLMVGGQSRAPLVQERLTLMFGRQPLTGVNPEEAVALGAALLANSLEHKDGLLLVDVLPMSIGVGLPGGRFYPVIPRNTALPATRKHRLTTTHDDQETLEISVFQGESVYVRDNTYLGHFKIENLPRGPKGSVAVSLSFELNNECLLRIAAKEESTGHEIASTFATKDTPAEIKKRLNTLEAEGPDFVEEFTPKKRGFGGWLKRLFGGI